VVLVRVLKSQALDLNGPRLVPRRQVAQHLLVHKDTALRLARAAGITTMVRVRSNRRDSPAMQLVRVPAVSSLPRVRISRRDNNRSTRRYEPARMSNEVAPAKQAADAAFGGKADIRHQSCDGARAERAQRALSDSTESTGAFCSLAATSIPARGWKRIYGLL
jgi:hypothetical protein